MVSDEVRRRVLGGNGLPSAFKDPTSSQGVMMTIQNVTNIPFANFIKNVPTEALEAMIKEAAHELNSRKSRN